MAVFSSSNALCCDDSTRLVLEIYFVESPIVSKYARFLCYFRRLKYGLRIVFMDSYCRVYDVYLLKKYGNIVNDEYKVM